jgi:GNAT superfamily N-acetyltransferase
VSEVWVAGEAEAAEVARLLLAFRDWMGGDQPSAESMAASVAKLLGDPATEYLLGGSSREGRPSGVCQLRFRHSVWTAAPDCWLEDLFVEEHHRGRGIGGAIVRFACERASARGARRIELDTNEDNGGAIALYESLGFSSSSKPHGELRGRDVFMGRRLQ